MRKFILTSTSFSGKITFGTDDNGLLTLYHNDAEMLEHQHRWLIEHLPLYQIDLIKLVEKIKGTLEEIPQDLSFEVFWTKYSLKINRKRAEPIYNKLIDADKLEAIMKVKAYDGYCIRAKRGKADPEKWLRNRMFETDWRRL